MANIADTLSGLRGGEVNPLRPKFIRAKTPGASEVKSNYKATTSASTTRGTAVNPTSGTAIRLLSVNILTVSSTVAVFEVYFGTGAGITNNLASAVAIAVLDTDNIPEAFYNWPDGGGPIGDVDEVLSIRTQTDITTSGVIITHYREE